MVVLGFMALGVPLVSSALGLASTASIDSRSKKQILRHQYCALGAGEYVNYLLNNTARWSQWWVDHPGGQETLDFCGQSVILSISIPAQPPIDSLSDGSYGPGQIPPLSAYNDRRLQTQKSVSAPNPLDPSTRVYTITATNRGGSEINLNKIHDVLPQGITYLGPSSGVTISDPQISGRQLTWDVAPLGLPPLQPAQYETLTFPVRVGGGLATGNYCNEAWVEPGGTKTRSGKTASINVGEPGNNLCMGEPSAVNFGKTVTSATNFTVASFTPPFITYSITIGYTITIENTGTGSRGIEEIRDLLPLGFCFVPGSATYDGGSIGDPETHMRGNSGCPDDSIRQRLTWDDLVYHLPSGATKTLVFQSQATVSAGDYWSDLLLTFDQFDDQWGDDPAYTWPTALVTIRDTFKVEAQIGDSNEIIGNFQVWVGTDSGTIHRWTVK